jgi:hypothetical protein
MATKPGTQPSWDSSNTNVVTPPGGKIVSGWAVNDVPPSSFFNWFWQLVSNWISYLNDSFFVGTSPGGPGLDATGGAPSNTITGGDGLHGHGTAGAAGTANGGSGVIGDAATSFGGSPGIGVKGNAVNQAGSAGVQGNGAGVAPGVQATGTATRPPLNLVPQATPSTPSSGDIWADTTTNAFVAQTPGGKISLTVQDAPIAVQGGVGYQHNWVDGAVSGGPSGARYWRDGLGQVFIDGAANLVGGIDAQVIFTLPAGFRPAREQRFSVANQGNVFVQIKVLTDGTVRVAGSNGVTNDLWFNFQFSLT